MSHLFRTLIAGIMMSTVSTGLLAAEAPPSEPTAAPRDPFLEQYKQASSAKDWTRAANGMREAVQKNPRNAEYHNLFAYSMRQGPNPDMGLVFKHYNEALKIDARHRGAHEYIGEAYLLSGNLAKAKEHLSELDKICFFGCGEFTSLKGKVAAFEAQKR